MFDDQLLNELERKRAKLVKALDQGEKINNLTASPEWEFFEEWLTSLDKQFTKQMRTGAFVKDHEGYIYAAALTSTIETILEGVKRFKKTYEHAGTELNNISKEMDRVQ